MRRRHPLPRIWLMTDERMGDQLWEALDRLPRGGGVVFRHYSLPLKKRRALFERVARYARRRGLVLVVAGSDRLGRANGVHNQPRRGDGIVTRSVHSQREQVTATRHGADLVFVSPIFATRSHPKANALGPVRLGLMIQDSRTPVVALGGMDTDKFRRLRGLGLHGWAGIDAFLEA